MVQDGSAKAARPQGRGRSSRPASAIWKVSQDVPGPARKAVCTERYQVKLLCFPPLHPTANQRLYNFVRTGDFMLHVVILLIVIGLLLWLATTYIPMDPAIKKILVAVVVIGTVLWILQVFGIFDLGVGEGFRHRYN